MSFNRWSSVPMIVGGSIIALFAAAWGMLYWHVPHWFIYIVSVLFVFTSAIRHPRRIYLAIVGMYIVAYIELDLLTAHLSFLIGSDIVQWISILAASEVIFQLSQQRHRTEEISQRRIQEQDAMNNVLEAISSELELNRLLQIITEQAAKLLNVTLGELLLYDRQTGDMEIVAQYPLGHSQIGFKMKPGEGAMGQVALTKQPLMVNDYKAFAHALPDQITTGIEAALDVPLLKGTEFVGVLGVGRHTKSQPFTKDDERLLTVFAGHASLAIENARLYTEVQHLAFTDSLTGINNRRRLFELLEKEYKRSRRYQRPLSLMLIDIDYFKKINDSHGHATGDEALRWFALQCSQLIRQKIDIIGRFGGEEFAVIYPETNLASAIGAAERLRSHLLTQSVHYNGFEIPITFSAGIASLPLESDAPLDQLVEQADKALYFAKEKRNCLAYWDHKDCCSHRLA